MALFSQILLSNILTPHTALRANPALATACCRWAAAALGKEVSELGSSGRIVKTTSHQGVKAYLQGAGRGQMGLSNITKDVSCC
jgi:hypothetical protein